LVLAPCIKNLCGFVMMARDHDQSGISHTRLSPKLLAMERAKNI